MVFSFFTRVYSIFLTVFLLVIQSSSAQTYQLSGSPLIDHLFHSNINFPHIRFLKEEPFTPYFKQTDQKFIHHLMKNRNGLFMTINGTGQVFKVTSSSPQHISVERMDSTVFWGNNFHSFDFSYKDTIFSLGGYGFWRFNGQLRYFKNGGEWYLTPLGEEYAVNSDLIHIDTISGKLYFIQLPFVDDITLKSNEGNRVFVVDVKSKSIHYLGKLNFTIKKNTDLTYFSAPFLDGLMLLQDKVWYLLRFRDNEVYTLTSPATNDWFYSGAKHYPKAYFQSRDSLYMYANVEDSLRSTSISMKDFSLTNQELFVSESKMKGFQIIMLVSGLLLFFILIYRFLNKKRKQFAARGNMTHTSSSELLPNNDPHAFTELELAIIDALISKDGSALTLSVEELNRIMGLGKKSAEVQKKTRRDAIYKVNQKYMLITGVRVNLIESRRLDEDKRYFQYYIPDELAIQFRQLFRQ